MMSPSRPTLTISVVDGQKVGEHDPLDLLKRGGKRLASVGSATLAMLVPREGSNMQSARLASTHAQTVATASSRLCLQHSHEPLRLCADIAASPLLRDSGNWSPVTDDRLPCDMSGRRIVCT